MKLLLAVDGSRYSKKALAFLLAHRERLLGSERGEDSLLHVINVQAALPARARSAVGAEIVNKFYEEEAKKVLKPICKFLDAHKISYSSEHRVGFISDEIIAAAKRRKAQMIIMGTHGHGALGRLLMGSVAQRVITDSSVAVLLIK
jgi:nucleotide-binding universal stress UspA family protein